MFSRLSTLPKTILRGLFPVAVLIAGAGTLQAASNGPAPVLVPYTITAIAGNTQSSVPGYGGDGVPGLSATLNGPNAIAVDSVGNVYIADQSNDLIREWNAQTGILKTIAGVAPTKCTGTTCTTTNPGCADGVPAVGSQVGSRMQGLVVDGYGNVYFSDYNYQGVWVIYKGGAQVASFINLVDATGVTTAGGVKPGYVYHIAGQAAPKAGGGCTGTSGAATKNSTDNVLATKALFHDPLQMGIDAAGNIYVQDYANSVVRVINTQATTQTFFGVSVAPGFVAAVVGCNATATTTCPSSTPPFGGPATAALYSNQLAGMTTDQYGNVYELDTKGATGSIYGGAAYAGGAPLAKLINLESGLTANPGSWYQVINNINSTNGPTTAIQAVLANGSNDIVLRPNSIAVDPLGNLYMMDYHWIAIYRVDVNSQMATRISTGLSFTSLGAPVGTNAAPAYCVGTSGPQTNDGYGDGCSIQNARFSPSGTGYVTFDGAGNLYVSDTGNNIVRKISVGTQFPSTTVGATLTQTMQMHFDAANLPSSTDATAFTVTSGGTDFKVNNVTCSNYTTGLDASTECYVTVAFTPTSTGTRSARLQATTVNGGVYPFTLTGSGAGPKIAIDGGGASPVTVSGLGSAAAVATDGVGNVYIADSANNQVVVSPKSGAQTTIGTGLKGPLGVAADAAGDVYIADSGNNRIVEVAAGTGAQTVVTSNVSNPHALALDAAGNLYIADTGNARILEVPAFGELSPSPLLAYTGAQPLVSPVGLAVDTLGNLYVADSGNSTGLIKIAAGGGDLQTSPGSSNLAAPATVLNFGTAFVTTPSGVAVDAAGNVYVSDSSSNNVQVLPAGAGPGSEPFALTLSGLKAPGALALDPSGNLYIADTGNSRVLLDNRNNVNANFGTVAEFAPAGTVPLTVTNIGTAPLTPAVPFVTLTGATANFSETDGCAASNFPLGTLSAGLHCSLTASFKPVVSGPLAATASVQGGAAVVNLIGVGQSPQVAITMAITSPSTGPNTSSPVVITLTATQPSGPITPTGTVTFTYTVNGVAQPPVTATLTPNGSKATTTLTINNLQPARTYVVNATYNGDASDSATVAAPFTFTLPGVAPLTVVANSVSYTYGGTVPTITGTVTGFLPADQAGITVTFTSDATSSSPVGSYPIRAVLSGGNAANYSAPAAVTSSGTPAVVTENPAPLTVKLGSITAAYGAPDAKYIDPSFLSVTGLVNGDAPTYTFTPANSSKVPVGTVAVVPTVSIPVKGSTYDKINNYKVTIVNGTLTVTPGASAITVGQAATAIFPTALASGALTLTAAPPQFGFYGTPTGTITITDVFTPLTSTGNGATVTQPKIVLPLVGGSAAYTPTDPTLGTHVYTFAYSGDSNFMATDTSATPTTLLVDQADFSVTSTTSPIQVAPGVIPGGNAAIAGEQAATPEIATVYIGDVLGSTQTVNLTCAVPADYITCTLTPATLTLTGKANLTSVIAVSVPLTLPANYKTSMLQREARNIAFAAIPLACLLLLPFGRNRKRRLPQLLLVLFSVAALVGASGCGGGNSVKFFTPVPAGPTQVVVTGTSGSITRSFTVPINIQ